MQTHTRSVFNRLALVRAGAIAVAMLVATPSLVKAVDDTLFIAANTGAGSVSADWHYGLDSVYLRLGDLRAQPLPSTGNIWVRANAYNLDVSPDAPADSYDQNTFGITAGIDKAARSKYAPFTWLLGGFIQMGGSNRDYDISGESEAKSISLGAYVTALFDNGWFIDAVAKYSHYKNTFDVNNPATLAATGADYNNAAIGLSIEAGFRMTLNEFLATSFTLLNNYWFEPSVQLAGAWIEDADYFTKDNIPVTSTRLNSWQARVQTRVGANFGKWIPYVKIGVAALRTDGGDVEIGRHIEAGGQKIRGISYAPADIDGFRFETGFGTSYQIDEHSQLYMDYEYNKASAYNRPWALNIGYRCAW